MDQSRQQKAAQIYARSALPLDPEKGWQREDVQVAFMAGMEARGIARLLTLPEVAEILAVSPSVIRDLVKYGELAYVHAGRGTERKHLTFSVAEIEGFIKPHTERQHYVLGAKTLRHGTRKRAHELAVERATTGSNDWFERTLAELKAKKK